MAITVAQEKVTLDLATEFGEQSCAKTSIQNDDKGDAYVSNSVDIYVSADADDKDVWVSISGHTYVNLHSGEEPFTTSVDILSHRFTKAQAEALLACLTSELAKLA